MRWEMKCKMSKSNMIKCDKGKWNDRWMKRDKMQGSDKIKCDKWDEDKWNMMKWKKVKWSDKWNMIKGIEIWKMMEGNDNEEWNEYERKMTNEVRPKVKCGEMKWSMRW